ncbi:MULTISPECIES: alpha/beta fold hydrolase [Hydrogenophaga]|jgi:pimeloyl-ACP methyl ester carboxylesterase|uniref:Alpha/beta hydrolase fold protein n=1 Tax=Hydrogenophaga intermedia TaxID=65786 RepID=A0A1L1PJ94_HYDIT|nr:MULTISPECIES: alpha/beta hydrolase [Hydrogenophaga]AOS78689.1 alpha/beta hydrolase [Hydrogenophaga sp. PBC]TMU73886.1 alpha/beta hydrolase [Hydrogenophaga intermedia]CDN90062.1 Alpha/beta hydrolase fold protein [Hydrogenophaga intermedia]
MELTVNGAKTYCYTGGKPFDAAKPTVVFIHGVLNDHSVWILQSRYLAHHGFNVLAVDLPGHARSQGEAPASVEDAADFIAALLDAAGVQRAALVGHSWGSLIALETAGRLKERITHAVLVGTAYPMKVSPALIEASLNEPEKALKMINVFSRSTLAAPPSALGPGTWVYGASMALGRRVLRSNAKVNVFHRGFVACDSYANGEAAMKALTCPVLFVLGAQDQMTQAKAAKTLIDTAKTAGKAFKVVTLPVGHHQMTETPDATLFAIRDFLK